MPLLVKPNTVRESWCCCSPYLSSSCLDESTWCTALATNTEYIDVQLNMQLRSKSLDTTDKHLIHAVGVSRVCCGVDDLLLCCGAAPSPSPSSQQAGCLTGQRLTLGRHTQTQTTLMPPCIIVANPPRLVKIANIARVSTGPQPLQQPAPTSSCRVLSEPSCSQHRWHHPAA